MIEKITQLMYMKTGMLLPNRVVVMIIILGISMVLFIGSLIFHFATFGMGGGSEDMDLENMDPVILEEYEGMEGL